MLHKLKAHILMVLVQFAYATLNVIYKLAIKDGMNMRVVTAYRLLFASAFTVPVALIFDRFFINTVFSFFYKLHHLLSQLIPPIIMINVKNTS